MLIKEYRIPLPLTVEEYRIAQLYMIAVSQYNLSIALCVFLLSIEATQKTRGKAFITYILLIK